MNKKATLESIYQLYMNDVYYYLLSLSRKKEIAEDLLQDTYYKAYFYLETFEGDKFKQWLFKIAYNTYIDWYRKSRRELVVVNDKLEGLLTSTNKSAEVEFFFNYEIDRWLCFTEQLNLQQRQAIILREIFDFSYDEIAEQINISNAAVKVAIFRARKRLKQLMESDDDGMQ